MDRPIGTGSGDVLVAAIDMEGKMSHKIDAPSGWSFARRDNIKGVLTKALYVRTLGSNEPNSYTFAFQRQATSRDCHRPGVAGVDPANPVAGSSGTGTSNSAAILAPEVTARSGGLLVGLFSTNAMTTIAPPSSMVEQAEAAQRPLASAASMELAGPGATGSRVALAAIAADNGGQLVLLNAR